MPEVEVQTPTLRRRRTIDEQVGDWCELAREIDSDRAHRRQIAQADSGGPSEVAWLDFKSAGPDVAAVHESHQTQGGRTRQRHSEFRGQVQYRSSADRPALIVERAHLEAAPAAQVRRPAEEVALRERHE